MSASRGAVRRAEAQLTPLGQAPFADLADLRFRLEQVRARPVRLLPMGFHAQLTGVWVALPDQDLIGYRRETTAFHQRRIVGHEAGHMLAGHAPAPVSSGLREELLAAALPESLLPDLDQLTGAVVRMLGRGGYGTADEHEAELIAALLCGRFAPPASASAARRSARLLDRLEAAMDAP